MPQYKLTYFDGRGLGELTRMTFAAAGVEFEDNRIKREDWPNVKPTTPMGQMPILEVDGKVLHQSKAIAKYVAREYGLMGSNNMEATKIDMVMEILSEIHSAGIKAHFEEDETRKAANATKLKDEVIPKCYKALESMLTANEKNSWFVGDKLSLADIAVCIQNSSLQNFKLDYSDKFPKIKALCGKVESNARISKWIETRPKTEW